MFFEFANSCGLSDQVGDFTTMWRDKMAGRSGQIRDPPRFLDMRSRRHDYDGTYTCRQGRKTDEIKSPGGVFSRREHYNMRPDTHCKIFTDSSSERTNTGFSAGVSLKQLSS